MTKYEALVCIAMHYALCRNDKTAECRNAEEICEVVSDAVTDFFAAAIDDGKSCIRTIVLVDEFAEHYSNK